VPQVVHAEALDPGRAGGRLPLIITAPDPDWLVAFTHKLVLDRLCASGHNFQPIRTVSRWQGQVYDKTEGRVALRTRRSLLPQIIERAKREHPTSCPASSPFRSSTAARTTCAGSSKRPRGEPPSLLSTAQLVRRAVDGP
jgi:periplasmic divalent cation tolerance protein